MKPQTVLFAIDAECVQEYFEMNYKRRLTNDELQRLQDAFIAVDPGDFIESAMDAASISTRHESS